MQKAECRALAQKYANENQKEVALIIRRKCWDFFEANKLPKGWSASEIVKPIQGQTTKKKSEGI
jgi:hypothetical protein